MCSTSRTTTIFYFLTIIHQLQGLYTGFCSTLVSNLIIFSISTIFVNLANRKEGTVQDIPVFYDWKNISVIQWKEESDIFIFIFLEFKIKTN